MRHFFMGDWAFYQLSRSLMWKGLGFYDCWLMNPNENGTPGSHLEFWDHPKLRKIGLKIKVKLGISRKSILNFARKLNGSTAENVHVHNLWKWREILFSSYLFNFRAISTPKPEVQNFDKHFSSLFYDKFWKCRFRAKF